ncbi:MAG: hypothetical protein L6R36_005475 [Xanthoria steineri]|nr:MAG: hypothetical protein L6R36_005475 [Xanthoria steineri]
MSPDCPEPSQRLDSRIPQTEVAGASGDWNQETQVARPVEACAFQASQRKPRRLDQRNHRALEDLKDRSLVRMPDTALTRVPIKGSYQFRRIGQPLTASDETLDVRTLFHSLQPDA